MMNTASACLQGVANSHVFSARCLGAGSAQAALATIGSANTVSAYRPCGDVFSNACSPAALSLTTRAQFSGDRKAKVALAGFAWTVAMTLPFEGHAAQPDASSASADMSAGEIAVVGGVIVLSAVCMGWAIIKSIRPDEMARFEQTSQPEIDTASVKVKGTRHP